MNIAMTSSDHVAQSPPAVLPRAVPTARTRAAGLRAVWFAKAFLVALVLCGAPAFAQLHAGAGRASITPDPQELPFPLGGYGARAGRPATGVHDAVHARALVLRDGEAAPVALVSVELCFITDNVRQEVLKRIEEQGFTDDTLFIAATHSHTSPDSMCMNSRNTFRLRHIGIYDQRLVDFTAERIAESVLQALDNLQPARLAAVQRKVPGLNLNRRQGEDLTDNEMTVMKIVGSGFGVQRSEGTGGTGVSPVAEEHGRDARATADARATGQDVLAVVVNYAAHPTIYGPAMMQVSGDWPGQLSRRIESEIDGVICLFINGAVGDTAPRADDSLPPHERVEKYGNDVAERALELLRDLEPIEQARVRAWVQRIETPAPTLSPEAVRHMGMPEVLLNVMLNQLAPRTLPVSFLQAGSVMLIGLPGEPSTPVVLEAKQIMRDNGHRTPAVAALTNDWAGYILSAEQYNAGGYEPAMSFYDDGLAAKLLETIEKNMAGQDVAQPPPAVPPDAVAELLPLGQMPSLLAGREVQVHVHAPDRLRVQIGGGDGELIFGRDRQELWAYVPARRFGIIGRAGVPRFSNVPDQLDETVLPPLPEPIPQQPIHAALRIEQDRVQVDQFQMPGALPEEDRWQIPAGEGDHIEVVALSHLTRFLDVMMRGLSQPIPPLGPATGERQVLATEGKGRLEMHDGTRVLFLRGSPQEMGRQQGVLLGDEVRDVVERILYGVGVASSFQKGRWFFKEIEEAQRRVWPFVPEHVIEEIDALADAAGIEREELRLANFFPELFHCSGFALYGAATADGAMYHGRILDYLRGVGLEQNAVVTVYQPDDGHAWVNLGYAGFIGSVTAMNEKHIAIGEMGGAMPGLWDGMPMAQLVRKVMEEATTIDEAVEIMRTTPRTCEYYYVISDGRSNRAVAIRATPDEFETLWAGESHPRLPHAFADAVLLSEGDRYEKLVQRVRENYGRFDAESAKRLMDDPVAMSSNIQSVLFAPQTLDFWVANADSQNIASRTRYTRYNLRNLLDASVE